ncbi:MAG: YbaK/EbsC family protein [archaeon]|nr:YbaK/EbsC family protein [archaeon]
MRDFLQEFIRVNRLAAQIFACDKEVHTAAQAAAKSGGDPEGVAKTILLMSSQGEPILVILLGKDMIDFSKIKALVRASDVRLAEPAEVIEITGFEVGGVPPVSIYGIRTFIDKAVLAKEEVVCGGGDPEHLMRIKVDEIMDNVEGIEVADTKK